MYSEWHPFTLFCLKAAITPRLRTQEINKKTVNFSLRKHSKRASYTSALRSVSTQVRPSPLITPAGGASATIWVADNFVDGSSHGRREEPRWCGWSHGNMCPSCPTCWHVTCWSLTVFVLLVGTYCVKWTCRTGAACCCWMTELSQGPWRQPWPGHTGTMEQRCAASGSPVSRGGFSDLVKQIQIQSQPNVLFLQIYRGQLLLLPWTCVIFYELFSFINYVVVKLSW